MTFQPSAMAYTQGFGSSPESVLWPHIDIRPPNASDVNYGIGKRWIDTVGQESYTLLAQTSIGGTLASVWNVGGIANASLAGSVTPVPAANFGTVSLASLTQLEGGTAPSGAVVPLANDVFTYVQSIVLAGANIAQTGVTGITNLATNAQAVAGTATVPGVTALAVQPSNLAAVFAAPPPIGTTPSTGAFTTLGATTVTFTAGGTWASGGTAIQIGQDASADNITIGGAGTRTIALGNSTATTSVSLNGGTGTSVNIGTNGIAHTVTIGNVTGATAVNINSGTAASAWTTTNGAFSLVTGTGTILIGNDAADHIITIGNSTGATPVAINAGTSGLTLGNNAIAHTVTIGNVTGATGVAINVGTNGLTLDGVTNSPFLFGPSTTTGAITIGGTAMTGAGIITLGSSTATSTVKIASGAGASTVTIGEGTAGANTVSIINGAIAAVGTVNILSGVGTAGAAGSAIHIANNQRVATIDLGNVAPTAARTTTINGGASAVNDTVAILNGAQSAGTQTLNIISGATTTTSAVQAVNIFGGAGSSSSQIFSVLNGANTNTTNTINLAGAGATGTLVTTNINTGAAAHVLNVGSTTGGNITFTQAVGSTFSIIGTGGTINFGADAAVANTISLGGTGANVIAIGNTQTAGSVTIGNAMTSGTIILGGAVGNTGAITIGRSTAGQTVNINDAASNTGANTVNILSGATPGASTTLNVMNGAGTAGTQTVNILASGATRAGAINLGTGIAAHVVTIGQVTSSLVVNCPETITLASGAATGLAVDTSAGTGIAATFKSVNATTDAIQLLAGSGGIKTAPTVVAAAGGPLTANNRFFQVTFTGISVAAGATQSLTVNNSVIAGASTVVQIVAYGCTSGAGMVIQSVTPAAGSVAVVITNPAAITTNTANLTLVGWVMN